MSKGSLYSVSDKALYDALHQHKVTNQNLRDIFLARGIIISKDSERDELAKYFSSFTHGYHDYSKLSRILGVNAKRERNSSISIQTKVDLDKTQICLEDVFSDFPEDEYNIEIFNVDDSIEVDIRYKKYDFNKPEFKQVIDKHAVITIEDNPDGLSIRYTLNDDTLDWIDALVEKIKNTSEDEDVIVDEISLLSVQDPKKRSEFFIKLTNSLDGFEFIDVTDVFVYHPKPDGEDEDDEKEKDNEVGEASFIFKASLKGTGVNMSSELQSLYKKGFYIWKIIWKSKLSHTLDDISEFEAQFSDPEDCIKFSYLPRGFYSYKGNSEYSSSKTKFDRAREKQLNTLLEKAAKKVLGEIIDS